MNVGSNSVRLFYSTYHCQFFGGFEIMVARIFCTVAYYQRCRDISVFN